MTITVGDKVTYTVTDGEFTAKVNSHGARLFKICVK